MHRTPLQRYSGWAARREAGALRLESHLQLAVPGEGESGCLFDEIQNLVEPIERSAMGQSHATNANIGSSGWSVSGAGLRSETG